MKTHICAFVTLLVVGLTNSRAQDNWTRKANFGGVTRAGATGFSIGTKGYIGLGDKYPVSYKDFWEYDPSANTWTQKADFGGDARLYAVGFTISGKAYVGTGQSGTFPNYTYYKDFWEYDPNANAWTRKSNFGGTSRYGAVGFSIDGKGYLGTGVDASITYKKDFWEFDPIQNTWMQKADFGGIQRKWGIGLSIGAKGYVGTGLDNNGILYKDFWEFDPSANSWSQKADFGGDARIVAAGFGIGDKGYVGTGETDIFYKDFWEFDPIANTWSQKSDFGGGRRNQAAGFSIGGKGYIGTGCVGPDCYNDFWEYTPGDSGGSTCVSPPSGLVSWWSGDRTADDMQGINPGELVGSASYKRGMVGPGFVFHGGLNDYVQVGDAPSLKMTTAMTMECWINPTRIQGSDIVNKEGEYVIGLDLPDGHFFWGFANTDPGWISISAGFVPPFGSWTHVAVTYDNNALITTYKNGVQVHQYQGSGLIGDVVPSLNDFRIGNRQQFPFPFAGRIDEVKVYNRALTPDEIAAIYGAGSNGNCKPKLFVSSITPSYEVAGGGFLVSTSVVIQDENGIAIEGASVQVKTKFPNGSVLVFPATTDATGQATISFGSRDTGLYTFTVRKVSHPIREYNASLNIETTDTLVIP